MDEEYISLVFDVDVNAEDALQGYFLLNHTVQGFEENNDGVTIHLPKEEWTEQAQNSLQEFLASLDTKCSLTEVKTYKNTDWNAQWEAGIEPLVISDELVITPSWRMDEALASHPKHIIVIDPKMSFGTGHHETTRLCLRMLESIDLHGKSVLDLGCGTAILAIYALKRGARSALGIDVDEWAVNNARENIAQNQLSFDVLLGDIDLLDKHTSFDLIIANIHRNVLLDIPQKIAAHQGKGGILLLSGILEWDTEEILSAYEQAGYQRQSISKENEWIAALMTKQ